MKKPVVAIFVPEHDEYLALVNSLDGIKFNNFTVEIFETGIGKNNTATTVNAFHADMQKRCEKPLLIIGAGICLSLTPQFKHGDAVLASSVVEGIWGNEDISLVPLKKWTLDLPLAKELRNNLASKGFSPVDVFTTETLLPDSTEKLESARMLNCLVWDLESCGLATACGEFFPEISWLGLRIVIDISADGALADAYARNDFIETLSLKTLIVLSTLDRMPMPSSCSSCRQPCGLKL